MRERKLEGGGSAWGLERADARWGRPGECDCGGRSGTAGEGGLV
eukprot:SAG11_NODE_128_length_15542_cov_6.432105_10_plen_44_part_00